ncbi:MAG TPA: V-type ATPase subunit [Candidatus Peribacteraceae bacterium]|nr:V-type ATPase subunit [Candidatus Peribacteraceae bacterium]
MLHAPPAIGQHFAFAHGRTGVLLQSLMVQTDIDHLLGTHDIAELERVIAELKMTQGIDRAQTDNASVLAALTDWIREEVISMTPAGKQTAFDILWMEGDIPLTAYLLKKLHGLTSEISVEPTDRLHAFPPEALRRLIEEDRDDGLLPKQLTHGIQSIRNAKDLTPREIDMRVAQLFADLSLALARGSRSTLILRFVKKRIDLQNIRTAHRLSENKETDTLPHLLAGGTLPPALLAGNIRRTAAALRRTGFSYQLADILESPRFDANRFERVLRDIEASAIDDMWNVPLGQEPLFAFAATALSQISYLRVLLIGKRNRLSPQQIKAILPPFLSPTHYAS